MKTPYLLKPLNFFKITITSTMLVGLAACTSPGTFFRQADSPLPLQTYDFTGDKIANTWAFETSDRLYVAGSIKRSTGHPSTTHMDVQLLDPHQHVIAEGKDNMNSPSRHPVIVGGQNRRNRYVVSFPLSKARQASKIIVRYYRSVTSADGSPSPFTNSPRL